MWMRCSYLIIELITRYFPFVFYLVLNFILQLLCKSLAPLTFPYSAQILLEKALFCRQNLSKPKASVCCVPFESQRQPWSTSWNPQHRTELIVNLKQPHKSESNTRKLLLYHLRKHIRVMNKIKRVRWSYVYCTCTLDIEAPWFWNTDLKVLFLCERRICRIGNGNFFPLCCESENFAADSSFHQSC